MFRHCVGIISLIVGAVAVRRESRALAEESVAGDVLLDKSDEDSGSEGCSESMVDKLCIKGLSLQKNQKKCMIELCNEDAVRQCCWAMEHYQLGVSLFAYDKDDFEEVTLEVPENDDYVDEGDFEELSLLDKTDRASRMREKFNQVAHGKDLGEWRTNVAVFLQKRLKSDHDGAAPGGDTSKWVERWDGKLEPKAKAVGKGAFGKVYVATLACNKAKVAVKQMRAEPSEVEGEANVMKTFTTPQFVQYFDHGKGRDGTFYILMEAALGDTLTKIVDRRNPSTNNDKAQLLVDMLTGIVEMHSKRVVHRDLKPANVLVSSICGGKVPCHAKVADLGLSCGMGSSPPGIPVCHGIAGTPLYIAPETYKSGLVDPANDVWALGMMFYEMLFTDLPSAIGNSKTMQQLESNIKNFKIEADIKFKRMDAGPKKDLLSGMLVGNYKKRMSAAKALELAKQLLTQEHPDAAGSLPPCWATGETVTESDITEDATDENVDFFTIPKALQDIEVSFIFNPEVVNQKTGFVVAGDAQYSKIEKYLKKSKLKPGDQILEVNDLQFTTLTGEQKDMLKSGAMGRSLTFKCIRA